MCYFKNCTILDKSWCLQNKDLVANTAFFYFQHADHIHLYITRYDVHTCLYAQLMLCGRASPLLCCNFSIGIRPTFIMQYDVEKIAFTKALTENVFM